MKILAPLALCLMLVACSSTGETTQGELQPITSGPRCSLATKPGVVASYSAGSNWANDYAAFDLYADGRLDEERTATSPDVIGRTSRRTVNIGAEAVTKLLADLEATCATQGQAGCYLEPEEKRVQDGGRGATFSFQRDGRLLVFLVAADAPEAVNRVENRLARVLDDVK